MWDEKLYKYVRSSSSDERLFKSDRSTSYDLLVKRTTKGIVVFNQQMLSSYLGPSGQLTTIIHWPSIVLLRICAGFYRLLL